MHGRRTGWTKWALPLALAGVLAGGCASSHEEGADGGGAGDAGLDGFVPPDTTPPPPPPDAGGEACGPVTCPPDRECCNASCGICVSPGESCPAIACVDAGEPVECGDATCPPGGRCCSGCEGERFCVEGPSCPDIDCPAPVDAGVETRCGGWLGDTCADDEYCDYPYDGCGFADGSGVCRDRPLGCDTFDCPGVCGCDGRTYCQECEAAMNGVDIQHEGPCEGTAGCEAMDARGSGPCAAVLGWVWDGDACRTISGCSCEGTDCGTLYESQDACRTARAACIDDCRATECPEGEWCQACATPDGLAWVCLPEGAVC